MTMRPETLLLRGQEAVEAHGSMERNGLLFGEWNRRVARIDAVARIFDLRDRGLVARVDDLHPADFFIRLAGFLHQLLLPGKHLVFVDIPQRADDFVFRARACIPFPGDTPCRRA